MLRRGSLPFLPASSLFWPATAYSPRPLLMSASSLPNACSFPWGTKTFAAVVALPHCSEPPLAPQSVSEGFASSSASSWSKLARRDTLNRPNRGRLAQLRLPAAALDSSPYDLLWLPWNVWNDYPCLLLPLLRLWLVGAVVPSRRPSTGTRIPVSTTDGY
jgi:hypothetical protein